MRDVLLEKAAKEVLVKEYGEKAVAIDQELNTLAKLIIKRKECIKAFNRGNFKAKEAYFNLKIEIEELIADINKKLLV